jgi:hypothetical protein
MDQDTKKTVGRPRGKTAQIKSTITESAEQVDMTKRFLICETLDGEMHSFPHPDPMLGGRADIVIQPNIPLVIKSLWLDDPFFQRAIQSGKIRVYSSDSAPGPKTVEIPAELELDNTAQVNSAYQIVNGPWGDIAKSLIMVEPREGGDRGTVNKEYLKTDHLKFLQNVLYQEERMRCRPEVIDFIKSRIEYIKNL